LDIVSISEATDTLDELLEQVGSTREPVLISGPQTSAVLVSLEQWNALQETLHLLSIPGMRESIVEGMSAPLDACAKKLDW
jgi:prevent-host-death family protein